MRGVKDWLVLVGFVALSQAAGLVGSLFTISAIAGWYSLLERPALSPPNWVFAPVWTTLYVLMGVAAFLVWKSGSGRRLRRAMLVFGLQLSLNALWSVLFFGLQSPALGLVCIAAMWLSIVWTIVLFGKISRPAAWLLVPYLAWVSFASYLNAAIWLLNGTGN